MKHLRTLFSVSLAFILAASLLTGCKKEESAAVSPFTHMTWENSIDDIIAAEGSEYTTYDSVYNGTTYAFPSDYMDRSGTVKYMFDDSDKLMCVAWTCPSDTNEDLKSIYDKIHQQVEDKCGKSSFNSENPTSYGDVWYLEGGNVILSVMTTDTQKALQYSYLHPDVSTKETES